VLTRRYLKTWGRGERHPGMIIGYLRSGRPVRLIAGGAGVAFDAAGPSSAGTSSATSPLTWTHTPAGTPSAVYAGLAVSNNGGAADTAYATAATYGGTAMTSMGKQSSGFTGLTGTAGFVEVFRIDAPAAGAQTVTITVTGATFDVITGGSVSVTGSGGESATVTGFAQFVAGATITVPSTTSGNLCLAFMTCGAGGVAFTTGTKRYEKDAGTNSAAGNTAAGTNPSSAGTTSLVWTQANDFYGAIAFEVQAPSALAVATTALPAAATSITYSQTLAASGGAPPYTWSVSSGALPSWASLNSSTGAVTGTPSSGQGGSAFTVEVTDSVAATATQPLTLAVHLPVTLVGSAGKASGTSSPLTAVYGQAPTAGSLLLAIVSAGSTTAETPNISTSATGWSRLISGSVGNNPSGTSKAVVDAWVKTAAGSDAAPTFTQTLSGTPVLTCFMYELAGANLTSPLDVSAVQQTGSGTGTVAFSITTGILGAYGEFAVSVFAQERASATLTWTETGSGWTSQGKLPASGAAVLFTQSNSQASAGPAALADAGHWSTQGTALGAGLIIAIQGVAVTGAGAAIAGTASLSTAAAQAAGATLTAAGSLTATQGPLVITGLAGGGTGYFADQNGSPRFLLGDNPWGLIPNAGRWAGTYQTDIDTYCNARGGQGFTAIYLDPLGNSENGGAFADGRTWDGVFPFTVNGTAATTAGVAGSAAIGLNSTFWARVDYFLTACARNGMTAMLNIGYNGPGDFATGGALTSLTATQFGQYGAALAARYATTKNIIWMVGNDYFGNSGGTLGSGGGSPGATDTLYESLLTGLRGGGDTHIISIHNYAESDSREDLGTGTTGTVQYWGNNHAAFNGNYTYNLTYLGIEDAWGEPDPIPVIQLDGYFYQGGPLYAGGTGSTAFDRAFRQDAWHAITSGARGVVQGSESTWQWAATALAASSTDWFYANNAANIRTLVESLPGWQALMPDTASALVTSGRGSRAATFVSGGGSGQYEAATTDSFVTASRTPDSGSGSSLALIYLSHATTIGIDQAKMVSGYQAYRGDPITGAKTSVTAGSSYNSSTWGNNSQGDPDWVLILAAPTALQGIATLPARGSVATAATQSAGAALSAAGSAATAATQGAGTAFGAAASLGNAAVQDAGGLLGGAGSLAPAALQGAVTALAAAGSLASTEMLGAITALGAAGSLASAEMLGAPAGLAAAGSLAAAAAQSAGVTLGAAGSLAATAAQNAIVTLSATGSLNAVTIQGAGVTLGAAGSLGTVTIQGAGGTLGAAGSLGTVTIQGAGGTLGAAGMLATAGVLSAPAVLMAAGSAGNGAGQGAGATTGAAGSLAAASVMGSVLSGGGSLGTAAALAAPAALAAAGSLSTAVILSAGVTLGGAASLGVMAVQAALVTLSATGSLGDVATQGAAGSLGGAGALSAAGVLGAITALAAAGSLTGTPAGGAVLSGAGSLAAPAVIAGVPAVLAAAGLLAASSAVAAPAALAAAGSLTAAAVLSAITTLTAAGSLSANPASGSGLAAAGSLAAVSAIAAPAALAAAGSLGSVSVQGPGGILSSAGSLASAAALGVVTTIGAAGSLGAIPSSGSALAAAGSLASAAVPGAVTSLSATASLASGGGIAGAGLLGAAGALTAAGAAAGGAGAVLGAAGSLGSGTVLRSAAALGGIAALITLAAQQGAGALAGTARLTATGLTHPPQVKGFSTAYGVTKISVSAASVTARGTAVAGVTQPFQTFPGVS
jgi:hypothetical protein